MGFFPYFSILFEFCTISFHLLVFLFLLLKNIYLNIHFREVSILFAKRSVCCKVLGEFQVDIVPSENRVKTTFWSTLLNDRNFILKYVKFLKFKICWQKWHIRRYENRMEELCAKHFREMSGILLSSRGKQIFATMRHHPATSIHFHRGSLPFFTPFRHKSFTSFYSIKKNDLYCTSV